MIFKTVFIFLIIYANAVFSHESHNRNTSALTIGPTTLGQCPSADIRVAFANNFIQSAIEARKTLSLSDGLEHGFTIFQCRIPYINKVCTSFPEQTFAYEYEYEYHLVEGINSKPTSIKLPETHPLHVHDALGQQVQDPLMSCRAIGSFHNHPRTFDQCLRRASNNAIQDILLDFGHADLSPACGPGRSDLRNSHNRQLPLIVDDRYYGVPKKTEATILQTTFTIYTTTNRYVATNLEWQCDAPPLPVECPVFACPCEAAFNQHVLPGLPEDGHQSFGGSRGTPWSKIYSGDLFGPGRLAVFRKDENRCNISVPRASIDIEIVYPLTGGGREQAQIGCNELSGVHGAGLPLHPVECNGGGGSLALFDCSIRR